ncbi:MAG: TIGR01777 family protein [Myxococcales bacterium]|nr:TIGR01777 family protein [Myxococcales bacterium]
MEVAITGSTGFIGRPLVHDLLAHGHRVLALSRFPEAEASRWPAGARVDRFSVGESVRPELLRGVDAVVHLAGENIGRRWTEERKRRILSSRVEGTEAISRVAAAAGVKVLLSASGVGYYGPRAAEPITEEDAAGDDFLARVCIAWEAATAPATEAKARVVLLRIGLVLHPGGGALARMLPAFRLGLGGPFGSGRQYVSWIHRGDLISLMRFCLERGGLSGPLNATSPNPVTNRDFARELGRALGRPSLIRAPSLALKLALGEMASMLLTGQRVLPAKALERGFRFEHPQLPEALSALLQEAVEPRPAGG